MRESSASNTSWGCILPTPCQFSKKYQAGSFYLVYKFPSTERAMKKVTLCGQWAPRNGYELRSAPCFEEYLNEPGSTAPEDLITDI
jgi:DNA gyrase inhibitor GyrI